MHRLAFRRFATVILALAATSVFAEDRPVSDGPVVYFSYIRVMPGQHDNYLRFLAKTWKPMMDEQKKAGLILDFSVYHNLARGPDDPDLILATTYPNMAALDDLDAKIDPLLAKVYGNLDQASLAKVERSSMRTDIGGDMFRKLVFK